MIAAASQNRAFNFAEILYYNQGTENTGWLNDAMVGQAVQHPRHPGPPGAQPPFRRLGVEQASTFDSQQAADKVSGTPTLFVGKSGTKGKQVPLQSPTDEQSLVPR